MKNKLTEQKFFAHTPEQFAELAQEALTHARKLGASDAAVDLSEGVGLSVSVRKGDTENVERNRDKSLGLSVYVGQRTGSASTSDFSIAAIQATVQEAYDIARFTAEDPHAGLPDEADLALDASQIIDLDLYHPWQLDVNDATQIALKAEQAAFDSSKKIVNSDGADASTYQSHFWLANSKGFQSGYAASRHSFSVAPIAKDKKSMERDYWYSAKRDPADLAAPEFVGRYAAERTLARLGARQIPTCECSVLFEAPLAAGLLGSFVGAVSGGSLYRRTSFLQDALGQEVFAPHIFIDENPFIPKARGSSPFDGEGVLTRVRRVVHQGQVQGYFLSSYTARKLSMRTTGNAGGTHNLYFGSTLTQAGDDLQAMLAKLNRGLFVTDLIGQGVNQVTGDYSRGACGFWVENGQIAYPVNEITIAGNLKEMFKQIVAIGADTDTYGSKTTGSVLIERMKVAGI